MSSQPVAVSSAVTGPEHAEQGLRQARYMQRKLEGIYKKTCQLLLPRREWLGEVENVLVWNKPMVSAFLYLLVHWAFV